MYFSGIDLTVFWSESANACIHFAKHWGKHWQQAECSDRSLKHARAKNQCAILKPKWRKQRVSEVKQRCGISVWQFSIHSWTDLTPLIIDIWYQLDFKKISQSLIKLNALNWWRDQQSELRNIRVRKSKN